MFIAGLGIGPVLGLLLADALGSRIGYGWRLVGLLVVTAIVVGFIPILATSLRIGLAGGIALGALLSATPMSMRAQPDG